MAGPQNLKSCPSCGSSAHASATQCFCGHVFAPQVFQAPPQTNVQLDQNRFIIALLLAVFLGHLGIHRFYLGRIGSGAAMLALELFGFATLCIGVGFILLGIAWVWWLVDLILIVTNTLTMADGTRLR